VYVGEKEEATEEEEAEDLLHTNKQTNNQPLNNLSFFFFFSFVYKRTATAKSVSCPVIANTIAPRHIQQTSFLSATPQYP
jgi:hypothetical protein